MDSGTGTENKSPPTIGSLLPSFPSATNSPSVPSSPSVPIAQPTSANTPSQPLVQALANPLGPQLKVGGKTKRRQRQKHKKTKTKH